MYQLKCLTSNFFFQGNFAHHLAVRAICLILIPCIIYITCFEIHFGMLPESGTGTSFMSPEFQTSLKGVKVPESTPIGKILIWLYIIQ